MEKRNAVSLFLLVMLMFSFTGVYAAENYFLLSKDTYTGNLGGISGADLKCLTEVNNYDFKGKPSGVTFTQDQVFAFLCDSSSCFNLKPNEVYTFARLGNTAYGGATFTTDSSGRGTGDRNWWGPVDHQGNPVMDYFGGYSGEKYWTGRNVLGGFAIDEYWSENPHTYTCADWSVDQGNWGINGINFKLGLINPDYQSGTYARYRWSDEPAENCDWQRGIVCVVEDVSAGAPEPPEENTCSDPSQVIMRLSSETNAHGEVYNGEGGYTTEICYDGAFGKVYDKTGENYHDCFPDEFNPFNKLLSLSAPTNAHAQTKESTGYDTPVCYGDLECQSLSDGSECSSISDEHVCVVILSDSTNAHLATCDTPDSYSILICCSSETAGAEVEETCEFTDSNWGVEETTEGTSVELNAWGNEFCGGEMVQFEVFEKELVGRDPAQTNPVNVVFSESSATGIWIAEWIDDGALQGNPEYVFKASLVNTPSMVIDDSGELIVVPSGGVVDDCINIKSCSDYLVEEECINDDSSVGCGVAAGNVEANHPFVICGEGYDCACIWDAEDEECRPSYTSSPKGYSGICADDEYTEDDCDDGFLMYNWTSDWTWGHEGWSSDTECKNVQETSGCVEGEDGRWYYDPDGSYDGCQPGGTVVECPAHIQVGFFNVWNFIIAIVILVAIYFLMERKRKKK